MSEFEITVKLPEETINQIAERTATIMRETQNSNAHDPDEKLTVKQSVPYLKLGEDRIKELLRQGKIVGTRPGSKWLITRREIDNYLNNGK